MHCVRAMWFYSNSTFLPRDAMLARAVFDVVVWLPVSPSQAGSVLFFSRPRSDGWPHHGRTFSIYPCPLSF